MELTCCTLYSAHLLPCHTVQQPHMLRIQKQKSFRRDTSWCHAYTSTLSALISHFERRRGNQGQLVGFCVSMHTMIRVMTVAFLISRCCCPLVRQHAQERYDAVWQKLPVNPRACPSEGAGPCIYNGWVARPASVHPKTIFSLALQTKTIVKQVCATFLRFRMGSHNHDKITGYKSKYS